MPDVGTVLQMPSLWPQSQCPTKVSPGKDQKSLTPVGQKIHAMVAKSHEDNEEAFTCVNV